MPELDWGQHLIDSLLEFGPCSQGMAGPVPVSFSEIEAWSRMTHISIPSYEVLQLRQLSKDYCSQYHQSSKPSEPQPMIDGEDKRQDHVAKGFASLIKHQKASK